MRMSGPIIVMACGAGLVVAGFVYDLLFAGLPYPDPTPAQQAQWLLHNARAEIVIALGLAGILAGCLWAGVAALLRRVRGR